MNRPAGERRFRRLLRWYPRAWRGEHGQALLGMLLDDADLAGRERPTAADTRAAIVHGLAARLTVRAAIIWSLVGVAASALARVALIWLMAPGADLQHETALFLSAGVAPAAAAVALTALLRSSGAVGDGRSLTIVAIAILGGVCGGLAAVSFSRGFDNADAGLPQTGLAAAVLPLAGAAILLSAVGVFLLLGATLSRTSLSAPVRFIAAAASAAVAAPIIGVAAFVSPLVSGVISLVVFILSLLPRRVRKVRARQSQPSEPVSEGRADKKPRTRAIRGLALSCVLVGGLGLAWAFTGSAWSPLGGDSTTAMRHGIILLSLGTAPGLIAAGLVARARGRVAHRDIWVPVGLTVAGFSSLGADYLTTAGSGDLGPLWIAAAALIGAAIGWVIASRMPVSNLLRVCIGAAVALTYTVLIGITLTPMLVFAAPVLGLVVLSLPRRREALAAAALA